MPPPALFVAIGDARAQRHGEREGRAAQSDGARRCRLSGLLASYRPRPAINVYLSSTYSSMPYFEPSRPRPDCFTPPNGATSVEMMPSLTPTMPLSSAPDTRHARPRSPV